jgi:hypothetical protein
MEISEIPDPSSQEIEKAQRALVLWLLRQLRREGRLIEVNGTISLKQEGGGRAAKKRA